MRPPVIAFAVAAAVACSGYALGADQSPQPLTRADCETAGMEWNDNTNVCGVSAPAQPLTRAGCDAAGMTWNDSNNVCGVPAAVAAAPAKSEKTMMAPGEKKTVKKVKTRHHKKKTVKKKKTAQEVTVKKKKRPILDWLKRSRNKP